MSGTIRSRTEARKAAHAPDIHSSAPQRHDVCNGCGMKWPCPDWVAADDTLTDLNNARWITAYDQGHPAERGRLIPDPDSRDWPMPKPPPYPADDEGEE